MTLTAGCGADAVVGVDDAGRPLPSLVQAGREYAALVTAGDRAGLAALAGDDAGADLDRVLAAYAGHPLRAVGYDGSDAGIAGIRFAVRCDARHTVRFGQTFRYADGHWHPGFRAYPPQRGMPTVHQQGVAAGGQLLRPTCPST